MTTFSKSAEDALRVVPLLPVDCEGVYSGGDMATRELSEIQSDIREIKTNLGWHLKVGGFFATAVIFLFFWVFVKLPEQLKQTAALNKSTAGSVAWVETALALNSTVPMPRDQVSDSLRSAKTMLDTARKNRTNIPTAVLASIQSGLLRTDVDAPGYWPMVFDFIAYRCVLITGMVPPPGPPSLIVRHGGTLYQRGGIFKGGAIRIDGLIDGAKFVGSWIEFDADTPATLINVQFDHCVLVFRGFNTESPPPMFRAIARQLLESSIADATITAKSS